MRTLILPLAAMLLAACAATPEPEASQQTAAAPAVSNDMYSGTHWKLVEADGGGPLQENAFDSGVTMAFNNGQISGRNGCNRYTGSYKWQGEKLIVGQLASTKMFCSGAAGEVEAAFHAWTRQPLERLIDTADLRLRGEQDGRTLVFVADTIDAVEQ